MPALERDQAKLAAGGTVYVLASAPKDYIAALEAFAVGLDRALEYEPWGTEADDTGYRFRLGSPA